MGKLEVKGIASRTMDYDRMKIKLEFYSNEDTPAEASNKVMKECEEFLRIAEKDGLNVSEMKLKEDKVYGKTSFSRDEEKTYYCGNRTIEIETGFDMKLINYIRTAINSEKMSVEFDVDFSLTNEEEIKKNLLQEALQDAKSQAEEMAKAIGQKVVGFVSADQKITQREIQKMNQDLLQCLSLCEDYDSHYDISNKLSATKTTVIESINTVWEIA